MTTANYCEDCHEAIDPEETLCEACSDRRFAEWTRHQDWLRMSDREHDDLIRWGAMHYG